CSQSFPSSSFCQESLPNELFLDYFGPQAMLCWVNAEETFDGYIVYMPLLKRFFVDDEELGKKDDDHRPTEGAMVGSTSRKWRPRRRRILIGIIALYLLYLFVKYIPTDVPPVSKRIDTRF